MAQDRPKIQQRKTAAEIQTDADRLVLRHQELLASWVNLLGLQSGGAAGRPLADDRYEIPAVARRKSA